MNAAVVFPDCDGPITTNLRCCPAAIASRSRRCDGCRSSLYLAAPITGVDAGSVNSSSAHCVIGRNDTGLRARRSIAFAHLAGELLICGVMGVVV
jgi:hypothetical protein